MKDYLHATFASTFAWAGNIYDLIIITYIYSELERFFHIGIFEVSLLFSIGLIGRFFGGLIFGRYINYIGNKNGMIIGTLGYSIASAGMAFSINVPMLFAFRTVQGIFMGGEWTTGTVLSYNYAPKNVSGAIVGFVQSGYGLGYALTGASYIVFLSVISYDWRLFLLTGLIPIAIAPYAFLKIPKENLKSYKKLNIKLGTYKIAILKSSIMMSGLFGAYFSIFSFYPTIAPEIGISGAIIGIVIIASNVIVSIAFITFGRLSDIASKKLLVIAGSASAMISSFFAIPAFGVIHMYSIPGIFVFSFSVGILTVIPLIIMERVADQAKSFVSGISYNLGALVGGVISVVVSLIVQIVPSISILYVINWVDVICLLAVIGTALTIKSMEKSYTLNKLNNIRNQN
ncbi:MFS transporter [Picrophilus oshimae]|uniref:Transporter n=1 Tax=Picrophilus torridus (strain ATCC 700027 / DSM 9790 / JCM 10055 / NBRC 100828 / KAW 2/3) TaxID=1122961 RepID=Q6L0E3_PICTO|nr:MFS transporter [Picrophilus oshimae]AAT43559.1 transporter [Picrophilus oshimae DSM 9789]